MSSTPRTYVVGLPVVVTVDNDGFISVEVDLAELAESVEPMTGPEGGWDTTMLRQWVKVHTVSNEGYAETDDHQPMGTSGVALG